MVITGDGGDEVLSGYPSYQGEYIASVLQRFPKIVTNFIPAIISALSAPFSGPIKIKWNWLSRFLYASSKDFKSRFIIKNAFTEMENIKSLISSIPQEIKIEDYFSDLLDKCVFQNPFYKLMFIHFKLILPELYLTKVDRMSMAQSLETRCPFLDFRLIEYMSGVHYKVKMEKLQRKSVLKRTFGRILPPELLNKPKKGFSVPLLKWFMDSALLETEDLQMKNLIRIGMNKTTILKIIQNNLCYKNNYGNFIWMLCILNKICR